METRRFSSLEVCAGSGAQALGLERVGFEPVMLLDNNRNACTTIRLNRPDWDVREEDVTEFDPAEHPDAYDVDLISTGPPRIKPAAATRTEYHRADRKVLEATIWLTVAVQPKALLLENVPELAVRDDYAQDRSWIEEELAHVGYRCFWNVLNASDFGVPQNRRSGVLVALAKPFHADFHWPLPDHDAAPTVGQVLGSSMAAHGWPGAHEWAARADRTAPALVGGSDRRGGPDLGQTGSKRAWAALGVDGNSLADDLPGRDFPADALPRLTVRQAAMIQSIPDDWIIYGRKTAMYRQVGNAMPPPLASALGRSIAAALAG